MKELETVEEFGCAGIVFIDFYADWCMPCKMLTPILSNIELEYDVKVLKVNADERKELAAANEITALPTIIVLKDGVQKAKLVGPNKKQLIDLVKSLKSE